MNPGHSSRDASMALRYGHMARTNAIFHAREGYVSAGTLMGVVRPKRAGKSTVFNAFAGQLPLHQEIVALSKAGGRRGRWPVPRRDSVGSVLPS